MLATEPAWQAQGLGKRMLQYAETYAVEHLTVDETPSGAVGCSGISR